MIMRNRQSHFLLCFSTILLLLYDIQSQKVNWKPLPTVRAGQIDSVVTLTTSSDVSPSITDQTAEFLDPIFNATSTSTYQVGFSLVSYQSWMTDTFSFNISLVALTASNITVRFRVLDNTFFTRAKIHYIVVQRNGTSTTNSLLPSPIPAIPTVYNDIEVIYGCYLTPSLRIGNDTRQQQIGPNINPAFVYSTIKAKNLSNSDIVMKTMISGMQLSNSVGFNDYVDVDTYFNGALVYYNITVQNNNYLTQICLTTVIYDPSVSNYYMMTIIESQTLSLNSTNAGLSSVPYSQRFDGMHRMFFGYSRFNLSMADTRYINVQTSNVSLISMLYDKNAAMNELVINMIFFVSRQCSNTSEYYNPLTYKCNISCPSSSIYYPNPTPPSSGNYFFCNPCHYSCESCFYGQNYKECKTCNYTHYNRTNLTSSKQCPCATNYTDVGVSKCVLCIDLIGGCLNCSSSTNCTECDSNLYVLNPITRKCDCKNSSSFLVTGYCVNFSGCIKAKNFDNNLTCVECDTSLNYIRNDSDLKCYCKQGYKQNKTTTPYKCQDICPDNITALGHCDDGNKIPGDGCDQQCNIQNGFHCTTHYYGPGDPGLSTCVLITSVSVTYLYAQRQVHTNQFTMAFKLNPGPPGLNSVSFNSTNFKTSLPIKNQKILYDPDTATVFLSAEYIENIEGTSHKLDISFTNSLNSFYAADINTNFKAIGINSQLIMDQNASYNTILQYVILGQGIFAILLAIFASVVGLKLAGIELLIPVQLIYFSLSTLSYMPSYISTLANLKYSNGYSSLLSYDYFRTYSQHQKLVAIQYETEFLLSTNIMIGIYLLTLLWLLVHHFILKYKENKLQSFLKQVAIQEDLKPKKLNRENQNDSFEDKEGQQDEQKVRLRHIPINSSNIAEENQLREDHHYSRKIFSFQVDRFYFIFYLILINQMFFGFNVMSLNLPLEKFYFPEELSVIVCNFMLFLMMGNVVFIFYDQQSNKMINFTCITDRYAYLYLFLNAAIIIIISFTFQQSFSVYIITALSSLFLLLIFIEKPYSKNLLQFENIVVIYLHVMLLTTQVLFCVVQSTQITQQIKLIVTCLIVGLIMLGEILTAIRIGLKVNFKKAFDDLKSPFADKDDDQKVKKKVIQKNLDLLGKDNVEIIPPDSVRDGLFTPKEKMIDWEARNTEEYQSLRQKDKGENNLQQEIKENQSEKNEEENSQRDEKLNELQLLKKRLRNNLKQKRQSEAASLANKKFD